MSQEPSVVDQVTTAVSMSTIFTIETILAVITSLADSVVIFAVIRKTSIYRIILPRLQLTREAGTIVNKMFKKHNKGQQPLTDAEYRFASTFLLSTAIRAAASIIVVGLIFSTSLQVLAPLFG